MKATSLTILLIIFLTISSCSSLVQKYSTPTTEEPTKMVTPTLSTDTSVLLKTSMGDFAVVSARLVDTAHENKAPDGYKYLLIGLAQPDLQKIIAGKFSFEAFQSMALSSDNKIYILGSDGIQTPYNGMGGWLDDEEAIADDFVMGFLVPLADTYTLYWNDNPSIPLSIEK
jgi:hypothetical protein